MNYSKPSNYASVLMIFFFQSNGYRFLKSRRRKGEEEDCVVRQDVRGINLARLNQPSDVQAKLFCIEKKASLYNITQFLLAVKSLDPPSWISPFLMGAN